ncbi:MAG: hypothetical protein AB1546_13530 [bacterium]
MSIYRINGITLSVPELYKWLQAYIILYRKGHLNKREIPQPLKQYFEALDGEELAGKILEYLKEREDFLKTLIDAVKEHALDALIEKHTD